MTAPGAGQEENGFGFAELRVAEPPAAGILRRFEGTKTRVLVASVDGSTVLGQVVAVSPDGLNFSLKTGEHLYFYVTEFVVFARQEIEV